MKHTYFWTLAIWMVTTVMPFTVEAATHNSSLQASWNAWVARQPVPCDPHLDSIGRFHAGSRKVAIILHGLGGAPKEMQSEISFFERAGYNVLAPRLSHHFDQNYMDLDQVTYGQWLQGVEEVFSMARRQGRVTLIGYSLGAVLASRLALTHPGSVERMVLIAPAWRISPTIGLGDFIGSIINGNANQIEGIPIACRMGEGYVPARAGLQLEWMLQDTENRFGGQYPSPAGSAFSKTAVPTLLLSTPNDKTTDVYAANFICSENRYCSEMSVQARDHMDIGHNTLRRRGAEGAHAGVPVGTVLGKFL